jgi:hypothetical protein
MKTASFAAVIALLSASVSAHAAVNQFMFPSDTLTVGAESVPIAEGSEPTMASIAVLFTEPVQNITGSHTITLTEPGQPNEISDIVNATITNATNGFFLTVSLTSDGETPLFSTADASFVETGAPQDLTSTFADLFDLNIPISLPTIAVTSDVGTVPEPSTWAMMALGFGLLGLLGYRQTRSDNALA